MNKDQVLQLIIEALEKVQEAMIDNNPDLLGYHINYLSELQSKEFKDD